MCINKQILNRLVGRGVLVLFDRQYFCIPENQTGQICGVLGKNTKYFASVSNEVVGWKTECVGSHRCVCGSSREWLRHCTAEHRLGDTN